MARFITAPVKIHSRRVGHGFPGHGHGQVAKEIQSCWRVTYVMPSRNRPLS
jgi:hypothetical protein